MDKLDKNDPELDKFLKEIEKLGWNWIWFENKIFTIHVEHLPCKIILKGGEYRLEPMQFVLPEAGFNYEI
jgi:hypothetical protein